MGTSVLPRPSPGPPGAPAAPAWQHGGPGPLREPHRAAGLVEFTLSPPAQLWRHGGRGVRSHPSPQLRPGGAGDVACVPTAGELPVRGVPGGTCPLAGPTAVACHPHTGPRGSPAHQPRGSPGRAGHHRAGQHQAEGGRGLGSVGTYRMAGGGVWRRRQGQARQGLVGCVPGARGCRPRRRREDWPQCWGSAQAPGTPGV